MKHLFSIVLAVVVVAACNEAKQSKPAEVVVAEKGGGAPEFFQLRPELEKVYGYTHAVKIGNDIKISGAVSMDDKGNPTAKGDLQQAASIPPPAASNT